MEHTTSGIYTDEMAGNIGVAERIGSGWWWAARSVLVVVSIAALVSFGGQVYFLPVLIPAQWLAARHSHRAGHALFTLLAALLVAEVGWVIGYQLVTETDAVVVGLLTGVLVGALFFSTSADHSGSPKTGRA